MPRSGSRTAPDIPSLRHKADRLEALGFEWDPIAAVWEKRFFELVRFKEEHGHCDVPSGWNKIPALRTWTGTQRTNYRRGDLSPERVERLEAIGFEWDAYVVSWEKRFSELVRFKEENGHCNVPRGWSKNPELGNWMNAQRTRAKKGRMTDEQRRRLDEIGFRF
ncbi:MAG: helicase associated domain-containing protein [Alphaproteobacteria bacterium]